MLSLKPGDPVQIVDRAATAADVKAGLYYNHYRNLAGTIFKLFGSGPTQQAAIDVPVANLPEELADRHLDLTDKLRAGLTAEARRNSGPGGENEFRLRYVVLVAISDLVRSKT